MLQLLRLRELPMLLAPARARGVGSRRGRAACAHFVSIASNCCGNFCGSYRTYGSSFPLCLCLAKKTNTLRPRTHTLTLHTHTHTQTYGERAQHSVRLSKILAFQRFFTCLCREKEKQFSMFTHFISPERRVVLSVPVPTPFPSSLHMPACLPGSHSVWQSPPFVPSPDRERFIECS